MKRINSIDFARGLVMVIMALDHTRDLLHTTALTQNPLNLATTTPILFFTRWVTHFCAPTFVFLSGTSAFISFKSKNNLAASRKFLLTRGLWLILLEFTLVTFALWADIHFQFFFFEVIATIGFGFIILGLLLNLPSRVILVIGLAIMALHNLVPVPPMQPGPTTITATSVLSPFFNMAFFPGTHNFAMAYPPIPWLGIMLTGFGIGPLFQLPVEKRRPVFLKIGLASLALFVIVRFINGYGDPNPWEPQHNGLYTFLSFLNVTKYPPSLDFCLLTLGALFVWLYVFEGIENRFTAILDIYGKVPLFYFIIHLYIIHLTLFLILSLQGIKTSEWVFGTNFGRPANAPSGVSLGAVYLIWLSIVALLYPVCRWYGRYKQNHREK
ncbi:MAG TPA: heparan-alpha-glucosaminide N-acetyltransferase domain-containing protein, partial [Puia sp.]|nr:heparan-alpha-glucosaminide N-acetyltransferase domain-containing protein [Puia sp.]